MKDKLIQDAINVDQLTPAQRELLAGYVEGMVGINNAYCLSSDDLQTLARYVWANRL